MLRRAYRGEIADVLPGYSGLSEIGGGAFATVYRAVEEETGRPVALKILKVDALNDRLVDTFNKEIRTLARVSDHPNIVTLYRPLMTPDGRPVLVLELCRESLAQRVRRTGPVNGQEATRIAIKIAGALETAHRHGFLHRDLKPQNILVTQFGEPALGDFGVAALQTIAQSTAGLFGFTTLHAAPEVLEGLQLSPATDVYALGSSLYQLLSGQAPFAAYDNEAPASVILRIIRDLVPPLRAEGVPVDLSDALEWALAKQPEARPQTAAEFAAALSEVEAVHDWPPTTFVAWGAEASAAAPATDVRPDPAPSPPAPVPSTSAADPGSTTMYARAPSVRIAEVEVHRPAITPPDPVVAPPAAPLAGSPRPVAPAQPLSSAPAEPQPQWPQSQWPQSQWIAAPPPPPPPRPKAGPSIASPAGAPRRVLLPGHTRRGNPRRAVSPTANPPLDPLPSTAQSSVPRPLFVDPPESSGPGAEGPLDQKAQSTGRPPGPARPVPVLWLAGVVAGVVVLVAALLLVAGVL